MIGQLLNEHKQAHYDTVIIVCSSHNSSLCHTWENFGLENLANRELFAKIFLANIHRYVHPKCI